MNILNKLIYASLLSIPLNVNAANFETPFTVVLPPEYINFCQNEIFATEFKDPAMIDFDMTEETLSSGLYVPLKTTIEQLFLQHSQTMINSLNKVRSEFERIKRDESDKRLDNEEKFRKQTIQEELIVEAKADLEGKKLFLGDSDELENEYFRQLCNEDKIREKTQSPKAKEQAGLKVTAQVENVLRNQQSTTSIASAMREKLEKSTELYCSEAEKQAGLCEFVSKIPNGDVNASIFMHPMGASEPTAVIGKTFYTYNQNESLVANDFISNVVGIIPIPSPSIDEMQNPRTQEFVSMYNMTLSSMTLIRQVLQEAYTRRMPISDFDTSLSYLDYLKIQNEEVISQKNMMLFSSTSKSGKQAKIFSAMAFSNKLNLELYNLNERINLLEAALISVKENNPANIIYMKDRK